MSLYLNNTCRQSKTICYIIHKLYFIFQDLINYKKSEFNDIFFPIGYLDIFS